MTHTAARASARANPTVPPPSATTRRPNRRLPTVRPVVAHATVRYAVSRTSTSPSSLSPPGSGKLNDRGSRRNTVLDHTAYPIATPRRATARSAAPAPTLVTMPARWPWIERAGPGRTIRDTEPRPGREEVVITASRSAGRPGQHRSDGELGSGRDLRPRQGGARIAGPATQHPVDDVGHSLVGSDALPPDLAHALGGHGPRRALDDAGQVDLLDDVLGQADEVEARHDGVDVQPLGDGIDVHLGDEGVEVEPVQDRADVDPRHRSVEVRPG